MAPAPPHAPTFVNPADEYVGIVAVAAEVARVSDDRPAVVDWLADWLCEVEPDVEPDVAEALADSEAAEPLVVVDVEADPVDADPLDDSDLEPDSLDVDAADPLSDADAVVELLVESGAADSLALCDVDWLVDSVAEAESLLEPVLPGARTALPSVASVLRLAALTSYETGVSSDMLYGPSSLHTGRAPCQL